MAKRIEIPSHILAYFTGLAAGNKRALRDYKRGYRRGLRLKAVLDGIASVEGFQSLVLTVRP
jgi:hypothetical protein